MLSIVYHKESIYWKAVLHWGTLQQIYPENEATMKLLSKLYQAINQKVLFISIVSISV